MSSTPAESEPTPAEPAAEPWPESESLPASERVPEIEPELVETEEPGEVLVRRAPRYGRFLSIGALLGVVLALILTFSFPENDEYSVGQVFGFLLLACLTFGVALGGLTAVLFDRAATKRARELAAVHETGRYLD